mmetsp:Transcript_39733/g.52046  ORF Transcript_39733/g.52046 Transcript_39733/m.52046 type:complete len:115 (+) Transcript_39733:95-439(+)
MQFTPDELDMIADPLYNFLVKASAEYDLSLTSFWKLIKKRFAGTKHKALQRWVSQLLDTLKGYIGAKQFGLIDKRNLWIIKPGAMSRGRNIQIHHDLDELVRCLTISSLRCWVT